MRGDWKNAGAHGIAPPRMLGRREAVRGRVLRMAAMIFFAVSSPVLHADGGVTLGQMDREGLRLTVFAAPVPVRAGLVDVSFLVQEIPSNLPVGDAEISCSVRKLSPPSPDPVRLPTWCSTFPPGTRIPATPGHSGNRLLRGAFVPVPEPGRWELTVQVARDGNEFSTTFPFDVRPPRPPLSTWWPFIALVPCAIILYIWRATLLRSPR